MNSPQDTEVKFELEGRTVSARLNPEDQAAIAELLSRGSITVTQPDTDTEGHLLHRATADDELWVDVEGHAMTLRLPNATDAAALRRALAVTALTATVAIGGFAAGQYAQTQAQTAPAAPITVPAAPAAVPHSITVSGDEGTADGAAQKAASEFAQTGGPKTVSLPVSAPSTTTTTGGSSDQDINVSQRPHQPAAAPAPAPEPAPGNRGDGSHPE